MWLDSLKARILDGKDVGLGDVEQLLILFYIFHGDCWSLSEHGDKEVSASIFTNSPASIVNPQIEIYLAADCCAWAVPQPFEKVQCCCVEGVIAGIGIHAAMS